MPNPTCENCGHAISRPITRRQQDIWTRIKAGMSNKEIARDLDLSEGTVKVHVAALYRSLGVKNRAGAAAAGTRTLTEQRFPVLAAPPTRLPAAVSCVASVLRERRRPGNGRFPVAPVPCLAGRS